MQKAYTLAEMSLVARQANAGMLGGRKPDRLIAIMLMVTAFRANSKFKRTKRSSGCLF